MADLLDKVEKAMLEVDDYYVSRDQAKAVIRVVLEEAAKVADWPYPDSDGWHEEACGRIEAARDIRNLILQVKKDD